MPFKVIGKTIDLTPTWEEITPVMIHIIRSGTDQKSVKDVEKEMLRMAKLADLYVKHQAGV
jgi:hypothetical protein